MLLDIANKFGINVFAAVTLAFNKLICVCCVEALLCSTIIAALAAVTFDCIAVIVESVGMYAAALVLLYDPTTPPATITLPPVVTPSCIRKVFAWVSTVISPLMPV